MPDDPPKKQRPSLRKRADAIMDFRCKNLIAMIEDPVDIRNIGTVIRNVNALGAEKAYIVDPKGALPRPPGNERLCQRRDLAPYQGPDKCLSA